MARKVLQPFYTAYVVVTFLICLFLAFPYFLIASIGNNPASRKRIWKFIHYWAKGWLWLIGMPVKIMGTKPPEGKYVIVSNHISYIDTIVIFPAIPSYFRALGKKEMSKIPLLGFIYKRILVMVDRSSQHSRSRSMRLMWRAIKNECSIAIFPEGTFNETANPLKDFYDGAFRLAINTQTPIFPILLLDTVHRWHYSHWWKLWPGKNRIVYLDPIDVTGTAIKDLPSLKKKVYDIMEEGLKKY